MNKEFEIIEVKNKRNIKDFLQLPVRLYKNEKRWIRPLNHDIEIVFDPQKNKHFRNGEAIRWILKNKHNKTIGRVAAFVDYKSAKNNDQPTGGMGFFECVHDRATAFTLFDLCKEWLKEKGMEAMDGPVNFGDRDRWWGLLVEGDREPNYRMPYNFLYYKDFFEEYGFRNYFNQLTFHRLVNEEGLSDSIRQKAYRIAQNPKYSFRHASKKNLNIIADEFRHVYNKAWARFPGVKKFTNVHAMALLNSIKTILDEKLIWFGYYENEPISFMIMLPEINPIIKHLNGKLNLIGKLKFLYYKKIKKSCKKAFALIFGVVPEHQKKGLEAAVIISFSKVALRSDFPYKEIELNWIGDFNPTMIRIVDEIGFKVIKTHVTYRYLFDRNKEFKRAKKVNV